MASLAELANQLFELRSEKSRLAAEGKDVQKKLDEVEAEMLEEMCQEGMSRLDIQGTGSFFMATRIFYKIADRELLMDFIHEQDDTDILTVQHQTLNAYAKEMQERKEAQGESDFEIPGVSFITKTQIRVRKARS
jgi:hypothetical protein